MEFSIPVNGEALIYLPKHLFVQGAPEDEISRVLFMSWLVTHQDALKTTRIVFDLGMRQDIHN